MAHACQPCPWTSATGKEGHHIHHPGTPLSVFCRTFSIFVSASHIPSRGHVPHALPPHCPIYSRSSGYLYPEHSAPGEACISIDSPLCALAATGRCLAAEDPLR